MTKNNYIKFIDFFTKHLFMLKTLRFLYKILPLFVFATYPTIVFLYGLQNGFLNNTFYKILFIPFCTFIAVTIFRKIFNFERPYEKYNTKNLTNKDTIGKSFPSRHVASAFIIAITLFYLNNTLGIIYFAIGFVIALTRIFAGVHFIRDVVAAALFSLLVGIVFLFLI